MSRFTSTSILTPPEAEDPCSGLSSQKAIGDTHIQGSSGVSLRCTCTGRLLAAHAKESGAWLHALPVSSFWAAYGQQGGPGGHGAPLRGHHPTVCQHCNNQVDHQGLHGLSCRKSQGRHPRHAAINDIIRRPLTSALSLGTNRHLPIRQEMTGWSHSYAVEDWQDPCEGHTCPDTYAPSHTLLATREAGAVAAQAE